MGLPIGIAEWGEWGCRLGWRMGLPDGVAGLGLPDGVAGIRYPTLLLHLGVELLKKLFFGFLGGH